MGSFIAAIVFMVCVDRADCERSGGQRRDTRHTDPGAKSLSGPEGCGCILMERPYRFGVMRSPNGVNFPRRAAALYSCYYAYVYDNKESRETVGG